MRWSRGVGLGSLVPILVLGAVASCDRTASGVEPTLQGPVEIPATEVRTIGTSESFVVVRDLEVLPDGTVWVLNSQAPFFVGFHPGGDPIAEHGAEGGGPDEFSLPVGLVTGGLDDEAWVLDVRRHAFVRVSKPDEPREEIRLPRESLPPGTLQGGMDLLTPSVRTARLGGHVVLPHSTGSLASGVVSLVQAILGAELLSFDPTTAAVAPIVNLAETLDDPFADFDDTEGGFPLWRRLWAVCSDHLRVFDQVRNQLRGFELSGTELEPVSLPRPFLSTVSPRQFARVTFSIRRAEVTGDVWSRLSPEDSLQLINEIAQGTQGNPSELAAYLPPFTDLRCSESGTMWIRPLDVEAGGLAGGRDWLEGRADGAWRVVRFPERFDALRFKEDRVWGVQRDELDVAHVAWAPLPSF